MMFKRATPEAIVGHGVQLNDVTFAVEGRNIISALSLDLAEQRVGIVGRNGSGKSTLARLITGLIAPTEGSVLVAGVDVAKDRKRAIQAVGILFQNPDHQIIFPTVEEEIMFGLTQLGESKVVAKAGAAEVLAQFNRSDWAEKSIYTLSQGQRHLVCLMAILVMQPKVIVLDEPYAGLDIPTMRVLNRYLRGLDQQVLHITHDPHSLTDYDRVLWIEEGRVHREGSAADVLLAFESEMIRLGDVDDLAHIPD
ncbi:energy-coupling factor ABC transporter ATP-binding protein [Cochlodiniinecator piscidefendens]|uniref:energy-coupling factor ABC transporter ATP-binding protein n=1 Tax=Cochlodiniinecator piscidefendens TaxID=2715756 RepID=UPI001E60B4C9|nr:ABC transporter ATP-binding protein [Cochlodiniinecator piscidefendens]